jgi:enolase
MSIHIKGILLRCILNSCGKLSVEAELNLEDGSRGIASVPVAIKAGRREKSRSRLTTLGRFDTDENIIELSRLLKKTEFETQDEFDAFLNSKQEITEIGTDITLALSLAFARASAFSRGLSFVQYLSSLEVFQSRIPHPIVNIFSGGIHGHANTLPFQQIMIVPNCNTFYEDIDSVLHIYDEIERRISNKFLLDGYSSSSGMLVKDLDYRILLEEVAEHITRLGYSRSVFLGVDVAAVQPH